MDLLKINKKPKLTSLILLGILCVLISNCATPPDVPVFVELDENRAYYAYTISKREGICDNGDNLFIDENFGEPKTWSEIKKNSLILPSFSWRELRAFIEKACKKYPSQCRNKNQIDNIDQLIME